MKEEEFASLFPEHDLKYFKIDGDGNVLYGTNINDLTDTSEPAFWQDKNAVKHLGLSHDQYLTYLTNPTNYLKTLKMFSKFSPKKIQSFWKPQEWSYNPDSNPPEIVLKTQDLNFEKFRIYVSPTLYFMLDNKLEIIVEKIDKVDFDDDKNLYCLILKAMYVLSYLGGMSLQNLKSENPIAKSLAHFYFYYHLKKFYNYRKFSQYNTEPVEKVEKFKTLYNWANHHVWYHSGIHYTEKELKRKKEDVVQNIHRDGKWVRYQTRLGKRYVGKDYLKLINTMGSGLTKTGQLLFQESCQAYVYCILGAQAKTRWKIIGDGANSFQTQRVFLTLVEEVIKTNNLSNLIKSMRLAINQTRVRLDFVISPGLELLPSQMIYIKDSPGYNNILLISNSSMRFGENNSVNIYKKREISETSPVKKSETSPVKKPETSTLKNFENALDTVKKHYEAEPSNTSILTTSFLIAAVLRVAWILI